MASMTPFTAKNRAPLVSPSIRSSSGSLPVLRQIDVGHLEQLDHRVRQALVRVPRGQQAGNQAAAQAIGPPQNGHLRRERRGVGPRAEGAGQLFVDHAEGHGFVETGRHEHLPHLVEHVVFGAAGRSGHRHADVFGNLVVTVDARDLFDQVDFARQIARQLGGTTSTVSRSALQLAIAERRRGFSAPCQRECRCPGCA